jgi:membrane protein implicated in regulation of membrane protease activity
MMIYVICLAVGLVFTVLCALFGHFFGGHDGDVSGGHDVGTGGHADSGYADSGIAALSFFSPTVLATFVTAFGAIGVILTKALGTPENPKVWATAPISAVGGLLIAWLVLWIFNTAFRKTQGSSEGHVMQLLGQEANVISPIPADGMGEIAYVQGGSRYTAPARTENGVAIHAGKPVKITRIVGNQFYVESINNPETKTL